MAAPTAIAEQHHAYLEANAEFDWERLQGIWSGAPEATFFNLNGHVYRGREQWTRLSNWEPFEAALRRRRGGARSAADRAPAARPDDRLDVERRRAVALHPAVDGRGKRDRRGRFRRPRRRARRRSSADEAVENRFLDRYAVAGDGADCRAAIARYVAAGVSEMVVTFVGPEPDRRHRLLRGIGAGRPAGEGARAG